jgi:hypothetical protein
VSDKKDSAIAMSENDSRKGSGEEETARKIDDNIPDLNAVNVKLSASAEIGTAESSKAAASIPAPAKIAPLKSQLEGVPQFPNAPKIPSVRDLDEAGEAKQTGADGAPVSISKAEDQRERDILNACVRADGLNHFISKDEVKALKARGIKRLPVAALPEEVEGQNFMQKLKFWENISRFKNGEKKEKGATVAEEKEKKIKLKLPI